ncbi:hypothetical protein K2173_018180 [Erythroxylum novogranatense]|uniref:Subtilisin-like protease SBT1.2 n=1 Tax=Erythroxylum novogranatense TaxID=1862640 RepID=A0AAV8TL51_9ROSI|nr:hypothetical protein K2173_018180 [Erythroxylum novogranatense]
MEEKRSNLFPSMVMFLLSLILMLGSSHANDGIEYGNNVGESELQTYLVFVAKPDAMVSAQSEDLESYYQTFLPVDISDNGEERMVHAYRNVVSGFAAKLTAEEVKAMEQKDGFLSARPQKLLQVHTTHSPRFLGLQHSFAFWSFSSVWESSSYGKGVIIGVLDTGISPDHPSFDDTGMSPPPAKWKGKCEFNGTLCNNKLIGARNLVAKDKNQPPLDVEGHGTHTASTAAGNFVNGANVYGNANGTAVGMAPLAHLAIYKVCSPSGCADADILAAMDAAVDDGVDVLSLSLGGDSSPFYDDNIALGAFGAIQKGIFVSCSAGNSGPGHKTLSNDAPWILTVGASTMDRNLRARVRLGDGQTFLGESIFQQVVTPAFRPLIAAGNASEPSIYCGSGSLEGVSVEGKIVLCQRGGKIARIDKGKEVKRAGGVGMILMNDKPDGYSTLADVHVLPSSHVAYADGRAIRAYINTQNPTAEIKFEGTIIGLPDAPTVTSFSSRGPSLPSPGILKPDIIGPGVNILAAWPVSVENNTNTTATFNIISGTSMSCPHLSGIAALLKSAHPDWSPAAIKSAMITTAYTSSRRGKPILDENHHPADLLATGAGHVYPIKASDPGLVYDLQPEDYIPYFCGLKYKDREISFIVQRQVKCSEVSSIPEAQLNYPSFSIIFGVQTQTYSRVVTNVGPANSTYTVKITPPPGVNVTVNPGNIVFSKNSQKATYNVTFSRNNGEQRTQEFAQGNIIWSSGKYVVRSPILVRLSDD